MTSLTEAFDERLREIETYLDLLEAFDRQLQKGPPKIGGGPITAQQQKILYSAVYLQLLDVSYRLALMPPRRSNDLSATRRGR